MVPPIVVLSHGGVREKVKQEGEDRADDWREVVMTTRTCSEYNDLGPDLEHTTSRKKSAMLCHHVVKVNHATTAHSTVQYHYPHPLINMPGGPGLPHPHPGLPLLPVESGCEWVILTRPWYAHTPPSLPCSAHAAPLLRPPRALSTGCNLATSHASTSPPATPLPISEVSKS
jgi:hypothetical protein